MKKKYYTKKKHEKCGYLNMIPMHFSHICNGWKWKMFFFLINIFIWNSERESIAERKKGNEVKAGKWKHVPYLYVRYIFLAGVTDIYSSGTHITIKFIVNGHPKLPIIECTPHWMMIERKLKFTIQLSLVSFRIHAKKIFLHYSSVLLHSQTVF